MTVIEHSHQIFGKRRSAEYRHIYRRPRRIARRRNFYVPEIRLLTGPRGNRWNV